MKKIHIAIAVFAAATLTSCMQEKSFNGHVIGENEVAFVLTGISTRSAEEVSPVQRGAIIELDADENGHKIFLEETIQDMNYISPATKGTPAYTENVGLLYKNNLGVYTPTESFGGDATFENVDSDLYKGGWRYYHNYPSDPWPDEESPVDFYLRMPAVMSGVSLDPTSPYSDGKIRFSYSSPGTAAEQEDILFAFSSISKKEHKENLPEGTPVVFQHALTGVKFAIANYDEENHISIKSITFKGMVGEGSCIVEPNAASNKVTWTLPENPDKKATYSSGTFGAPRDFNGGGSFGNNGNYPDSFAAAGNTQNLNDSDASQTFWFIPQEMTEDVVLTIVYTFGTTTEKTGILQMGKILSTNGNSIAWEAGQLRTYTIKVDEVNLKIEDTVTIPEGATPENGYSHSIKENVVITNTGNTKAFIRAAVVGQWLDSDGNPVFGFTDNINQLYLVESWYEDQFVKTEAGKHGIFVGLPGYKGAPTFKADSNASDADPTVGWQLCTDGYYYYTKEVDPGQATGSSLFTSYETLIAPKAQLAGKILETATMHFELEVAAQAISAVKVDGREGSLYTWKEAWENATGTEPVEK